MMEFTKADLVILQLNRFRDVPYEKLDMPYGMTQDGIAEAFIEFAKREGLSFFQ